MSSPSVQVRQGLDRPAPRRLPAALRYLLDIPLPVVALAAYLFLKPFYLGPPGQPQISDVVIVALLAVLLVVGTARPQARSIRVLTMGAPFIVYTAMVGVAWALLLTRPDMLKPPVFLIYNFVMVALCLVLADRYGDRFFRYTLFAVAGTIVFQVVLSVVAASPTRRQVIYFYNPNQLGYWALLSASIFFVCALRTHVNVWVKGVVCLASMYLFALSLSKAAMISSLGLFGLAFATRPRQLLGAIPIAGLVLLAVSGTELAENVLWRLDNIGQQQDDSFAVRGYALLFKHPEYLLLGAGDGFFERFYIWDDREFHSTLGGILFSYGIVGLTLFTVFLYGIYREAGLYRFAFLSPAFLYGLTHQGLRFSLFWVLFALVAASSREEGVQTRAP